MGSDTFRVDGWVLSVVRLFYPVLNDLNNTLVVAPELKTVCELVVLPAEEHQLIPHCYQQNHLCMRTAMLISSFGFEGASACRAK